MKRFTILTVALLLLCGSAFPQNREKSYVIGFYNLENLFDIYDDPAKNDEEFLPDGKNKWTAEKYNRKIHNMARVIRAMRDDNNAYHAILGISEIENRMVIDDLVGDSQIADANFQIVHYDGPDRRGVDVALLYRPEVFKYIDSESIPFNFEDTKVKITLTKEEQERFKTRDILMVHGTIEGEHFAIYVCHLPSRLGGKGGDLRSRGAEIIYNHSRAMACKYHGIKIVVMGDMNDNPTDESQTVWLHGRERINDRMIRDDFFSPFHSMYKDGYGSLAYKGQWNIYDIIQVNYDLAVAPRGGLRIKKIVKDKYYGRVFHKPFMTQNSGQFRDMPFRTFSNGAFIGGYSDHYPTFIKISK